MLSGVIKSRSCSQRSGLTAGFLSDFVQPFIRQLLAQPLEIPFTTYFESEYKIIGKSQRSSFCKATIHPINSMRLLVVRENPPEYSCLLSPSTIIAPYPPGPGLLMLPPSVYIVISPTLGDVLKVVALSPLAVIFFFFPCK